MGKRQAGIERYWDQRARENALYFVDNRLDYHDPDAEAFWAGGERDLDTLLELVGHRPGRDDVVLDIGCGVGRLTRALAGQVQRVIGLDVSAEMLAQARELNVGVDNVEWIHGDGATLRPIADASVDGCFSHVVFQHLPDPDLTLGYVREMGRVLRPGGWAVFQVSTDPGVHGPRGLRTRLRGLMHRGPRGLNDPAWRGSSVALDALERTATESGLAVEFTTGAGTQYTLVHLRRNGIAPDAKFNDPRL